MLSKLVFQHSLTVLFSLSVTVTQLGLEGETPIFIQIYHIELLTRLIYNFNKIGISPSVLFFQ